MEPKDFQALLAQRAEAAGGQRELAAQLGISQQFLSDVISGRRGPGKALLKALGMVERLSYELPEAPIIAGAPSETTPTPALRVLSGPRPLTLEEAIAKTSAVVRLAYAEAVAKHTTPANKKAATITMAVALDKWLALTGRPTQIMSYANVEEMRPAVRALALRLLALKPANARPGEPPTP